MSFTRFTFFPFVQAPIGEFASFLYVIIVESSYRFKLFLMTQLYSILCNCLLFSFNSFLLSQILMIPCFRSGVFDVP